MVCSSEIIQLLEGSSAPADCVDSPEVWPHSDRCVTHDIWDEVKEAISKALGSATLQDLAEHPREKVWQRRLKK